MYCSEYFVVLKRKQRTAKNKSWLSAKLIFLLPAHNFEIVRRHLCLEPIRNSLLDRSPLPVGEIWTAAVLALFFKNDASVQSVQCIHTVVKSYLRYLRVSLYFHPPETTRHHRLHRISHQRSEWTRCNRGWQIFLKWIYSADDLCFL